MYFLVVSMLVYDVVLCGLFFVFSSRRRHTICALVTGVQTCALPISRKIRIGRYCVRSTMERCSPVVRYGVSAPFLRGALGQRAARRKRCGQEIRPPCRQKRGGGWQNGSGPC